MNAPPSTTSQEPALVPAGWSTPGIVAGLWLLDTLLHVLHQLLLPGTTTTFFVSSVLYMSAGPVLAALVASAIARRGDHLLALAASLLLIDCLALVCSLPLQWLFKDSREGVGAVTFGVWVLAIVASGWVVDHTLRASTPMMRRSAALLAAMCIVGATPYASAFDQKLVELSNRLNGTGGRDENFVDIDPERLWTTQPLLVERALADIRPSNGVAGNAFLVTVAAGGIQDIFGREARVARSVLGRAFGAEHRTLLLANDEASLFKAPLAANSNLDATLVGVARKMDSSRDLAIIYLASHGNREGALSTDLPDYDELEAISAERLAQALQRAGIRRRIIIISACFAGSWIKPLATDDTIVIAASHANRASFGCSDDRELTYFGEALLKGKLKSGASLSESFEAARKTVNAWEADLSAPRSEPQAFVGKNMTAVWKARPSEAAAAANR